MVMFVNSTGIIGQILTNGTTSITGSMFLTLFMIFLILIGIGLMLQIPLEIVLTLLLPFAIGTGAFYGGFWAIVVIIILYLAAIIAKNTLFR